MHTVKAIYPGTFDPLTNGHLDLIARGAKIVDELVVAILRNTEKGEPLFTDGAVALYTDDPIMLGGAHDVTTALSAVLKAIPEHGYLAVMAYLDRQADEPTEPPPQPPCWRS